MLRYQLDNRLTERKSKINAKGMIYEVNPQYQIWGDANIINFKGNPISMNTIIDNETKVRFNVFTSGAMACGLPQISHSTIYRIDNCHEDRIIHEHDKGERINITDKTIRQIIKRVFSKFDF